jgi:hypothetical protein
MDVARNQDFFGRTKVLQTIESALCESVALIPTTSSEYSRLKPFAICGPGGIGKSEVAAEFVYRVRAQDEFDAIFWVRADDAANLSEDFKKIATKLGLFVDGSPDMKNPVKVRDRVLQWLARPIKSSQRSVSKDTEEASWLLVFDDVNNSDILSDYYPHDSPGSVLITTRDPYVQHYISDDRKMVMPPFEDAEATSFLLRLTSREKKHSERKSATEVAQLLGGYPLAITHMARLIGRYDYSFPEFRQRYEPDRARRTLFSIYAGPAKTRPGYHHTLATVWKLDDLEESATLLDVISLLDASGIPEFIVRGNPVCQQWKGYPQDDSSFEDARLELLKSSLITRDRNTAVIKTHTIVQDTVRASMDDKKFNSLFRHVFRMLSAVWPYEDRFGFGHENSRWSGPTGLEELFSHILHLQKIFPRFDPTTELTEESLELYNLALDAAW